MSKKFYTVAFVTIVSTFFLSAQFTEKRSKRAPSMNALKESCCSAFGSVLHASADLLSSLGAVQKQALNAVEAYAQGDKQGWCAIASREKLSRCQKKLELLYSRIESLQRECDDTLSSLGAL